jgi:hypothetical protein
MTLAIGENEPANNDHGNQDQAVPVLLSLLPLAAALKPPPSDPFGIEDEEGAAVDLDEVGAAVNLLDGRDVLSEAEIEELKKYVSKPGEDIIEGAVNRDKIVSREDGLRLRGNTLTSLPVSAKFHCVRRHFTVSQGFAHELLYQANNRAAEVTMYGDGGSINEDYDGVLPLSRR